MLFVFHSALTNLNNTSAKQVFFLCVYVCVEGGEVAKRYFGGID